MQRQILGFHGACFWLFSGLYFPPHLFCVCRPRPTRIQLPSFAVYSELGQLPCFSASLRA